jgi:predicted flap endonuclease-1-like 5' DNA nuclease
MIIIKLGCENMIGAVVFVIVFVLFLLLSLAGISLPLGNWIIQEYIPDIMGTGYEGLVEGIINGVIYGVIIWFIFTIVKMFYDRMQGPQEVVVKVKESAAIKEVAPRSASVGDIKGIGPAYAKKLKDEEIKTTDDLLKAGSTKTGRKELAEKTGISERLILEWVNRADLSRIQGIAEEYSALLEEAGVDTVVELARRNPENLHATIVGINEAKGLVLRTPSLSSVKDWVEQAKTLPRKIEY